MKTKIGIAFALLTLVASSAASAGALDGSRYRVKLTNVKSEKSWRHRLVFARDRFESLECRKHGFKKTSYESDGKTFTATASSKRGGTATWKGKIDGDAVEGTLEWKRPKAERATHYTFAGKVVGRKKRASSAAE